MLSLLLVLILSLCFFLYRKKSKYWQNKGIPGPTPLPLVGNLGASLAGMKNLAEVYGDIYLQYPDYPFVGIFRMIDPCLILRDPEIIKNIMVKDFSYFVNNDIFVDKNLDPLLGVNPFVLKNEEWKKARHSLTPGFAPAKIKSIFPLIESVAKNFARYLERHENVALDAKEISGRYTCDTVALHGFGLDGNSFDDPNAQFLQIVRKFVSPDSLQAIKLAISFFLPHLMKVKVIPKSFDDAVIDVTKDTLKYRQENNIKRNDYFETVAQIPNATMAEIAGHLAGLIVDGYETSSTAMTFMFYELAKNPECQQKLRDEINTVLEKHKGEFSHEILKEMIYLEACVNEALRMHPPLAQLSKTCTKSYTISSTSSDFKDLNVTLEPGSSVIIPLLGLHMDPKYFPSPEKFMPERFLEKDDSYKYVYMPFGNGPRACLGSRLGLLQSKVGLVTVIKDFEITLDEKTREPLKYDPLYFLLNPRGGAWIKCRKISKEETL